MVTNDFEILHMQFYANYLESISFVFKFGQLP